MLGKSYSLGWPDVLFVLCLFVILVIPVFGFEGRIWVLIAQFLVIAYLSLISSFHCERAKLW